MLRRLARASLLLAAVTTPTACNQSSASAPAEVILRPVGAWTGQRSQTLGFPSDTGRFRVIWRCSVSDAKSSPSFALAVHSAVSGRPLHHLTDHCGAGTLLVEDDPRLFNLMVTAEGTSWTVSVEELVTVAARP